MKPPSFEYRRAESFAHAGEILSSHGDDAKILAGGQTLIPMLNFRLARPKLLVDISNIPGRDQVTDEPDGIRVKATTVHRYVEKSAAVQEKLPLLHQAIKHIAHFQIRNKGTLGGSIANADPAAELPAMSLVFDATFDVSSRRGHRIISANDFFITYMTTLLEPDEILESVFFALPPKGSGWGFQEIARRSGDYALAGSTADLLLGQTYSQELVKEAAHLVQQVVDPEPDVHVTAEYRRSVSEVLTVRVLDDAFRRAGARAYH